MSVLSLQHTCELVAREGKGVTGSRYSPEAEDLTRLLDTRQAVWLNHSESTDSTQTLLAQARVTLGFRDPLDPLSHSPAHL